MVIQKRSEAVTKSLNNNEHSRTELYEKLKKLTPETRPGTGAILLDVLKTLETEIRTRNLFSSVHSFPFHPLWFQAENERNIFLWRNGFSIIEKDEFEFWVDIPSLIKKRKDALKNATFNHPLSNPNWPSMNDAAHAIELESAYLAELSELFLKLAEHATALCEASSMAIKELCAHEPAKAIVVLPIKRVLK